MTQEEVSPLLDRTHAPLVAVGALAGRARATQGDRADLPDQPMDCATVDIDVAALAATIPGPGERAAAGVGRLVPVARIAGPVRGGLDGRSEIALARTEDDPRRPIAGIEAACPCAGAAHADAVR